jgi:hypothetical protein
MDTDEALENLLDHATEQGSFSEPSGTDELRDALRALADVRTLDEGGRWDCFLNALGEWTVFTSGPRPGRPKFTGKTADEARAKAADWVRGEK